VFDATREVKPGLTDQPNQSPKPEVVSWTATVGLAKDYFSMVEPGGVTAIFHFPTRRIVTLEPSKKTFSDDSLYGLVAFRVNELINRGAQRAAFLALEKRETSPQRRKQLDSLLKSFDRFRSESQFSLLTPVKDNVVTVAAFQTVPHGKGWDIVYDGETVVRFVPSGVRVPDAFLRSYHHYLSYSCQIHPLIRDKILATRMVPETLSFANVGMLEKRSTTFKLRSAATVVEEWAGIPRDYTREHNPASRLDRVLQKFEVQKDQIHLTSRSEMIQFVDEAMKRNAYLDAYLEWWEYFHITGDTAMDVRRWVVGTRSEQLRPFTRPRAQSREADASYAEELKAIDRKGLTKGYMIDVTRAGLLSQLGRADEAEDLYLKALEANPALTGAFEMLGEIYYREFRTNEAWRCFDTARKIGPNTRFLKEVQSLEARLVKDFPDEF
jgi:hypothetical protein